MSNIDFDVKCIRADPQKGICDLGAGSSNDEPVYGMFVGDSGSASAMNRIGITNNFDNTPTTATTSRVYFPNPAVNQGITAIQNTADPNQPYTEFQLPPGVYKVDWQVHIGWARAYPFSAQPIPNYVFGLLARPTTGSPVPVAGTGRNMQLNINMVYTHQDGVQTVPDVLGTPVNVLSDDAKYGYGQTNGSVLIQVDDPTTNYSLSWLSGAPSSGVEPINYSFNFTNNMNLSSIRFERIDS